jgi:hypothetical protein
MNRNSVQYVFFVLLTLAICAGQAQRADSAREQTSFSEASPIRHPVPLPPTVLKLLLQREEVKDNWAEISDAEEKKGTSLLFSIFPAVETARSPSAKAGLKACPETIRPAGAGLGL